MHSCTACCACVNCTSTVVVVVGVLHYKLCEWPAWVVIVAVWRGTKESERERERERATCVISSASNATAVNWLAGWLLVVIAFCLEFSCCARYFFLSDSIFYFYDFIALAYKLYLVFNSSSYQVSSIDHHFANLHFQSFFFWSSFALQTIHCISKCHFLKIKCHVSCSYRSERYGV